MKIVKKLLFILLSLFAVIIGILTGDEVLLDPLSNLFRKEKRME